MKYFFTIIFILFFFLGLVITYPFALILYYIFGLKGLKLVVSSVAYYFISIKKIFLFVKVTHNYKEIPNDKSIIIVSNHQSLFDIPFITYYYRNNSPMFIAKKSLGKYLFTISFNLKKNGILIDRKNPTQSVNAILRGAKDASITNRSISIFPEGTRSKDGVMKKFKSKGLVTLIENMPNAMILPITVNNSSKLFTNGGFPMNLFVKLSFYQHELIDPKEYKLDEITNICENIIKSKLIN